MSIHFLAKRTTQTPFLFFLTNFHGFHHSTSLCSTYCEGRLQRQGRIPRFTKQQVCLLIGSYLPLLHSHFCNLNCRLYCSYYQVSSPLPPPPSLLVQEKMLNFSLWGFSSKYFEPGFSISCPQSKFIARSMPFSADYTGFFDGFCKLKLPCKCMSIWGLPKFDFVRKMVIVESRGHCRSFSTLPMFGFVGKTMPLEFGGRYRVFSALPKFCFARKMRALEYGGHHRTLSGLPEFVRVRKTVPLRCEGHYRRFSSSISEEERESDGDGEEEEGKGGEVNHESSADPEEVRRVAKVIDELFALDRNMEAVLDECGINLSHDLVVDVLRRFTRARRPAFRFFCWAGQRPGFSHDSRTYNAMLMILGKTRQFETMVSLLEEMGEKGVLNMESFMIAIQSYAAGKERKKAVGVFDLMKKYGFKVEVETVNCLLEALARQKLAKEAQALYDRLKSRFMPNVKTYSILLGGWCKVKNLMETGRIWNEMIDQGLKPDLVTHNIMLDGLLKVKKRSDAIKLFEIMKAKGPAPDFRSYTILMRDLCKHSKMTEAVAYFNEMLASGCEPDAGVFTCLITGFGNVNNMDMVYVSLKKMTEKGHPPDGQLYNALIKLMTSRRMPDDAVRIYKKMIQNGHEPSIHTYNMMMKSYFMAGNSEMACTIWDQMVQHGCCPDENSYTVLIGGLIRHGRSEQACKYVEEMISKGMRVPDLDFNKFVADFSRVGRPNILEELARKMRLSGKSEVSEIFSRWAEMTQKRIRRRDPVYADA